MKDKSKFGAFIKEKRISKNYSQKDLAKLLYVTESAVSKWERGITYPDITLITDICKVLDISEHELISSSDDEELRRLKKESAKYNKIKKIIFWTLNISYFLTILICFIVNLAVNHSISWFFIVLGSIIVAYAFCPTFIWLFKKFKMLVFIGSTLLSFLTLFLIINIYTNNYWFLIPTVGILLGYFIIFYPILFKFQKHYLEDTKYLLLKKWFLLTYFLGVFIIIIILLIVIYFYSSFNILLGITITGGCFILPILFGIIMLFNNKLILKISIIALSTIVLLYLLTSISIAVGLKFTERSNTYIVDETFENLIIDFDTSDITVYLSESVETKIICTENKLIKLDYEILNNNLIIKKEDNRKFYEKMLNFTDFKLEIYLSQHMLNELSIKSTTGNITIEKGLTINDLSISNSTGNISLKANVINDAFVMVETGNISIKNSFIGGNLKIEESTGNIKLESVLCDTLDIKTSTGNTTLKNVLITKDLNVKGSTGDLNLDEIDASDIYIELSTGSVKGVILSSKFFIAESDTGNVSVPKTTDGGYCIITVSTGNINIILKENN